MTTERRLRTAGVLIIAGLVVAMVSLLWSHPTAFLVFLGVGGAFLLAGIGYYLYALVTPDGAAPRETRGPS